MRRQTDTLTRTDASTTTINTASTDRLESS